MRFFFVWIWSWWFQKKPKFVTGAWCSSEEFKGMPVSTLRGILHCFECTRGEGIFRVLSVDRLEINWLYIAVLSDGLIHRVWKPSDWALPFQKEHSLSERVNVLHRCWVEFLVVIWQRLVKQILWWGCGILSFINMHIGERAWFFGVVLNFGPAELNYWSKCRSRCYFNEIQIRVIHAI